MTLIGRVFEFDPDASDEDRDRDWFSALMYRENQSRRGMCLASASAIEEMLTILLKAKKGKRARSFQSSIEEARVKGILSDIEADSCQVIREIRNVFAHEENAYFERGKLAILSKRLKHIDGGLAGFDGSWLYYQAAQKIALALRARIREQSTGAT